MLTLAIWRTQAAILELKAFALRLNVDVDTVIPPLTPAVTSHDGYGGGGGCPPAGSDRNHSAEQSINHTTFYSSGGNKDNPVHSLNNHSLSLLQESKM